MQGGGWCAIPLDELESAVARTARSLDDMRLGANETLKQAEARGAVRDIVRASSAVRRIDRARATLHERPPPERSGGTPPREGEASPGDTHAVTVHHNTPVVKKAT